ncbi:NAD(P)H-dependent oxidoreductase [Croceimicrobium sp.]|uniref:NAD(P)H-dependent oxidoreductase n=1 Tax=Croceimicrobium sp. TaxID=2828340 RepID=UPI003BA8B470
MQLLKALNWRYATKKFDSDRKLRNEQLNFLKEAIRLSVSSYGLQSYKVLIIENEALRKELRKVSWDQPQITDASHLFIFCARKTDIDAEVDAFVNRVEDKGSAAPAIQEYGQSIKASLKRKSVEELRNWSARQTYIALNSLMIACAEAEIDACPMEGFDADAYNRILALEEEGYEVTVIAPVGFRSTEDQSQFRPKLRKSEKELFEYIE